MLYFDLSTWLTVLLLECIILVLLPPLVFDLKDKMFFICWDTNDTKQLSEVALIVQVASVDLQSQIYGLVTCKLIPREELTGNKKKGSYREEMDEKTEIGTAKWDLNGAKTWDRSVHLES